MMLLTAVKTNNRPRVECLVGDIWHILRGLFSPFVLVSDSAVYTYEQRFMDSGFMDANAQERKSGHADVSPLLL